MSAGSSHLAERWEVHESITVIDPAEWNAVVSASGGSVFSTHEWLLAYEESPPEPLHSVRHLTMRRGGELILVAPLYEISEDPHLVGYGPEYDFDHPLLHSRMLVGHSWYSYYNGVCARAHPDRYADALASHLHDIATGLGTPVYGFPGVPYDDPLCAALARRGFQGVLTEATSRMELTGTFDDYLGRLNGKHRTEFRRRAKRHINRGASMRHDVCDGDADALANLVEQVCARHNSAPVHPAANLASIFRHLAESIIFVSLWHDDTILGGNLMLRHEGVLYGWLMGLDYDRLQEFGTYHALKWEQLRLAYDMGFRRIEVGRGMYELKTKLEMDPIPLVSWLRPASADGAAMLETGLVALDQGCRTRQRVFDAYEKAARTPPRSWSDASLIATGTG